MDFDRSTQAKSWLFDEESLRICRSQATAAYKVDISKPRVKSVRSFASGFHRMQQSTTTNAPCDTEPMLDATDQESLVQFHAHQLQTLVGPTALLPELRTSVAVLSTAVILFRRFYLSNSVIFFNPRKMLTACAYFAAKVEEERVQVDLLSHATAVVQLKVQQAPLCRNELRSVSVMEIQEYEKLLMQGLNYEFRCHHPFSAMHALALDYSNFSAKNDIDVDIDDVLERASAVVQRALVFSDVNFMFAPGHIGFAAVAIALGTAEGDSGRIGEGLRSYLQDRFARKSKSELDNFEDAVNRIIQCLYKCPNMDLAPANGLNTTCGVVAKRAEDMKRVLRKVASIRMHMMQRRSSIEGYRPSRKRCRIEKEFTPPRSIRFAKYSANKVTPVYHHQELDA